jgi:hypothetical protein
MDATDVGEIDTASIMRKLAFFEQNLNNKADKIEVVQAREYSDEKIANVEKTMDAVRTEISNFRVDFSLFRSKDFAGHDARLKALEARKSTDRSGANSDVPHGPEYALPSTGIKVDESSVNNRLTNLEANYNDLRD